MSYQKALALIVSGLFAFWMPAGTSGQASLRFTPEAMSAYRHITRLDVQQAESLLRGMERTDPDNQITAFLRVEQAFIHCLISESPAAFDRFGKLFPQGLQRVRAVGTQTPWRGHCLGEMYLMNGIIAYKQRDFFQAARDIRRGYRTIQEGLSRFPKFLPSRRDMAILQLLIGTVPDQYQWGVELISGIKGSTSRGRQILAEITKSMAAQGHFMKEESAFLEAILLHHVLGQTGTAYDLSTTLHKREPHHPFLLFLRAFMAQENGLNDETIRLLSTRLDYPGRAPFPYLTYLLGKAYLYRLDLGMAHTAITRWLEDWQGTSLRADACQKLAWCALLEGYDGDYKRWMNRCAEQDPVYLEQDRQAQADAREGEPPHPGLLRARLLFDGGYLAEAREALDRIQPATLVREDDRLEQSYRRGRIAQAGGQQEEAVKWFATTWASGQSSPRHFACASALQLGRIYQAEGDVREARLWYERCLSVQPDRYRDGLHQKAKAGLLQMAE